MKAENCVYVGDGGSQELEMAAKLGMQTIQAVWYLKEGTLQTSKRMEAFTQAERPLEVLGYVKK